MAEYSFKLPDLGEGTVESEIATWRVNVGDHVDADQPLVDMMTDKAHHRDHGSGQRHTPCRRRRTRRGHRGGLRTGGLCY